MKIFNINNNAFTDITSYESILTNAYETSSEEFNIGSGGDLFIAKNYDLLYGLSQNLGIVDINKCAHEGYVCLGENSENPQLLGNYQGTQNLYVDQNSGFSYTLASYNSLGISPVGFQTKTVYDQNHIVTVLIPALETIRNLFFLSEAYQNTTTDNACYSSDDILEINQYPCYTYYENLDTESPYMLAFDVNNDIHFSIQYYICVLLLMMAL